MTARRKPNVPPWAYDRDFIAVLADDFLPRICAEIGVRRALGVIPPPAWWPHRNDSRFAPQRETEILILQRDRRCIFLDRATHEWVDPTHARAGHDLIELAAWSWRISEAKAAWRLARLCGRAVPRP